MKLTEEELKDLYRVRIAASPPERLGCLSEELLRRAAAKELTRDERQRVVGHLRECSACAQEYRAAHESRRWSAQVVRLIDQTAAIANAESRGKPANPFSVLWARVMSTQILRTAAFATMILIAVGASLVAWRALQPTPKPTPIERGGPVLSLQVEPTDRAQLNEAPQQLSWTEVKEAESYQVALFDFELTPVWESEQVKITYARIPDSVRSALPTGRAIYWRVIVNKGIERQQSELFQFVIAGGPR